MEAQGMTTLSAPTSLSVCCPVCIPRETVTLAPSTGPVPGHSEHAIEQVCVVCTYAYISIYIHLLKYFLKFMKIL